VKVSAGSFLFKMEKELIVFGRGGQGAKTLSLLLAESALEGKKFIQAFPEYGPERAGAPVKAFVRISDKPILIHSDIEKADVLIVVDKGLLDKESMNHLKKNGVLIINSDKKIKTNFKTYCVDASKIAIDLFGKDIPNTALLGAIVKITGLVKLDKLKENLRKKFVDKFGEELTRKNLKAVEQGYKNVRN